MYTRKPINEMTQINKCHQVSGVEYKIKSEKKKCRAQSTNEIVKYARSFVIPSKMFMVAIGANAAVLNDERSRIYLSKYYRWRNVFTYFLWRFYVVESAI